MKVYSLPKILRDRLKHPSGKLIKNSKVNTNNLKGEFTSKALIVAVGDATTETLLSLGFIPNIEVVDGREMRITRKLPKSNYESLIKVKNPHSCLTEESLQAVSDALSEKMPVRIFVDGEEDLLALPIMASYPIGTIVVYGQPRIGLVFNCLDLEIRKSVITMLNMMGIYM
ncbi:MAG TPA: GTP-dependent dephospho-CoA kinase family protein [Nitrososphaerales archaeon]|jgi:hypothetical protein|nr:GTP-dependent dephospho-CoA kinase family protein [Nitrososphaerales archaeon]|tara:strand:+ start:1434 stop:1946 length:513 start_codon:yes stop_codon:yes gene_type:complete